MAFSGNTIYELQAGSIVESAFKKIGVQPAEQSLQAFELQDGLDVLNLMLKTWQAQQFHLWTMKEGVVFLEVGDNTRNLGPNGDNACELDDFIPTTLTADAAVGATTISVTSTVGMVAGDYIGIQNGNSTMQWTTIVSVDSTTGLTITDALTAAVTSAWTVFTYTTKVTRPSRIPSVRRVTYPNSIFVVAEKISRDVFYNQPIQNQSGVVSLFYYDPQLIDGKLMVWETGQSANDYLRISYQEYIDTITDTSQTLEIPPEWQECVVYNLASRLADDYNVPVEKANRIGQMAALMLEQCLGYDEEPTKYAVIANYNRYNTTGTG